MRTTAHEPNASSPGFSNIMGAQVPNHSLKRPPCRVGVALAKAQTLASSARSAQFFTQAPPSSGVRFQE
jgi:hypothetical protein